MSKPKSFDEEEPRSAFAKPGFIISAFCLGVMILAGAAIWVFKPVEQPASLETPKAPTTLVPSGRACDKETSEQTTLTDAPIVEDWVVVGSMLAPDAPGTLGPSVVDENGIRSCWEHSPAGAAMFASNYFTQVSDIRRMPYVTQLVQAGPGRDIMEAAFKDSVPGVAQNRITISGVKLLTYDPVGETTVDVLLKSVASGQLVSFPIVTIWEDGDWKLVTTDSGGFPLSSSVVNSPAGYLPWAGE